MVVDIGTVTPGNEPSDMCAQRRFRSACAFAQADQNLHWANFGKSRCKFPLCRQRRLCSDGADDYIDLSLYWTHMSEGTLSHIAAHFHLIEIKSKNKHVLEAGKLKACQLDAYSKRRPYTACQQRQSRLGCRDTFTRLYYIITWFRLPWWRSKAVIKLHYCAKWYRPSSLFAYSLRLLFPRGVPN